MQSTIKLENQYSAHNYAPLPVVLVKGQGVYLWDDTGKKYLDFMSVYSAVSHGHCHPKLLAALSKQAQKLTLTSRAFHTDQLGSFLKSACEFSGQDKALPMNTGAEAIETAIKAARKWAYTVKNIPRDKAEIIVCKGNFHGRTTTIISFSSTEQYRHGFGPFTPGFKIIEYGSISALEKAMTKNTAAFLVEPIQGEAGIIVPPKNYLKKCAEICKKHNVLLICDEIQTGLARTGKLFAYQHDGIIPDGMVIGKALGGGLIPVSLFLSRKDVIDVFTPGDHGSTFGGNPLACAIAQEALKIIIEEHFAKNAETLGNYFIEQLKQIKNPSIKEVRGKGLLIGVEFNQPIAHDVCLKLMEKGLLTKETHKTTIRFAPPLVITKNQIDEALKIIETTL